jgi:hypothetical protein
MRPLLQPYLANRAEIGQPAGDDRAQRRAGLPPCRARGGLRRILAPSIVAKASGSVAKNCGSIGGAARLQGSLLVETTALWAPVPLKRGPR